MSLKFLSNLDMNKNQLENLTLQNSDTAPSNPTEGQTYFNTTNHKLYYYNGTEWVDMTGSGSGSGMSTRKTIITCDLPDLVSISDDEAVDIAENDYLTIYPESNIYGSSDGSTSTGYIIGIRNSSDTTLICSYLINKYTAIIEDRDYNE